MRVGFAALVHGGDLDDEAGAGRFGGRLRRASGGAARGNGASSAAVAAARRTVGAVADGAAAGERRSRSVSAGGLRLLETLGVGEGFLRGERRIRRQ